jgi:hypothetical protein
MTDIDKLQAREFVEIHSKEIRDRHELTGDSDIDFFLRATESQAGEDTGYGELIFEVSASDSRNGCPWLFYLKMYPLQEIEL